MPWPIPADKCHSAGTPMAASACDTLKQRLRRNEFVLVAVHQQYRGTRLDVRGKRLGIAVRRQHQ